KAWVTRRCPIVAGGAAEGMLVTMPKRYDQDPANKAIVEALKSRQERSQRSVCLDHLRRRPVTGDRNDA
ncbi:hypothetical protein LFZ31_18210, partial [Salmonella enterica subsp. enterica serovar Newport str. S09097]